MTSYRLFVCLSKTYRIEFRRLRRYRISQNFLESVLSFTVSASVRLRMFDTFHGRIYNIFIGEGKGGQVIRQGGGASQEVKFVKLYINAHSIEHTFYY